MQLNRKALENVEIGIPIIREGIYHAKFKSVEVKPNKKGDGNNLVVQVQVLDNPLNLHKTGAEIQNKGNCVYFRHISLVPTDNYDPDTAMKELQIALGLPKDKDLMLEDLKSDKIFMVKLDYKPESTGADGKKYPDGMDIKRFTPLPEDDHFTAPPI